jgi:uncharacterized protein (TIGR02058 family)
MTAKRVILELGSGNDLHGGDYTKAALRAVQDALHHSSLSMLRSLGVAPASMQIAVTIGVQRPERVDAERVRASLPHGKVTVTVVKGGLDVPEDGRDDTAVIASAAIDVRLDLPLTAGHRGLRFRGMGCAAAGRLARLTTCQSADFAGT